MQKLFNEFDLVQLSELNRCQFEMSTMLRLSSYTSKESSDTFRQKVWQKISLRTRDKNCNHFSLAAAFESLWYCKLVSFVLSMVDVLGFLTWSVFCCVCENRIIFFSFACNHFAVVYFLCVCLAHSVFRLIVIPGANKQFLLQDETRKKAASTYLVENSDIPPPRYQKDGTLPMNYPNNTANSGTSINFIPLLLQTKPKLATSFLLVVSELSSFCLSQRNDKRKMHCSLSIPHTQDVKQMKIKAKRKNHLSLSIRALTCTCAPFRFDSA